MSIEVLYFIKSKHVVEIGKQRNDNLPYVPAERNVKRMKLKLQRNFTCTFPLRAGLRGWKAPQVCRVPALQRDHHTEVVPPSLSHLSICSVTETSLEVDQLQGIPALSFALPDISNVRGQKYLSWVARSLQRESEIKAKISSKSPHLATRSVAPSSLLVYQERRVVAHGPVDGRLRVHWAGQGSIERNHQQSETEYLEHLESWTQGW